MKQFAAIFAGLWVCATAAVAEEATGLKAEVISRAAPYIEVALTKPMAELYDQAITEGEKAEETTNALHFGLALYAGRHPAYGFEESDLTALRALEARVRPLVAEQLKKHPNAKLTQEKWRKIVKATDDDMALVDAFQKLVMADYWLTLGRDTKTRMTGSQMLSRLGAGPARSGGYDLGPVTATTTTTLRVVPLSVYITATHCIYAVRQSVGLKHYRPNELPVVIRTLWDFAPNDAEGWTLKNLKDGSVKNIPIVTLGAAACGTEAQFNAYVTKLKV
ncbi:MAG: hypothetical protein B7Z26_04560, partial [Asticcacaulis sp. 32-58-5]